MSGKSNFFTKRNLLSAKQEEAKLEKQIRYRERAISTLQDKFHYEEEDEDELVFSDEDEKEEESKFAILKASYDTWEKYGDTLKREIKESVFCQANQFEKLKHEKSNLVDELKAWKKEASKARHANHDLEEKVEFLYSEIEELEVGKSMLADELEACREEVDRLDKASRDLDRKTIRATRSDKDFNKKLQMGVKAERKKFVAELDASTEEVKRLNKALEKLNSDFLEIKASDEKTKLANELEASRDQEKKSKNALETRNSDFLEMKKVHLSTRLENEHYKKQNDELGNIMKEEKIKFANELKASRDQDGKSKKAFETLNSDFLEMKKALLSTRLENEHYKKLNSFFVDYKEHVDEHRVFMEEEKRKLAEA